MADELGKKQRIQVVDNIFPAQPKSDAQTSFTPDEYYRQGLLSLLNRSANIMSTPAAYATSAIYTGGLDDLNNSLGKKNFDAYTSAIENPLDAKDATEAVRRFGGLLENTGKALDIPLPTSKEHLEELSKNPDTFSQYKTGGLSFLGMPFAHTYKSTDNPAMKEAIATGSDLAFDPSNIGMEALAPLGAGMTRTVKEMTKRFGPELGEIIGKELERKAANIYGPLVDKPISPVDKLVKEPPFETWFKDSKIIDKDGNPKVMYHATPEFNGNEFKKTKSINNTGGNPEGFYFSPFKADAEQYVQNVWDKRVENPEKGLVIPAYLDSKNPYRPHTDKMNPTMLEQYRKELREINPKVSDDWIDEYLKKGYISDWALSPGGMPPEKVSAAKQRIIKAGGYDSYVDGDHVAVFDPKQIRSAYRKDQNFNIGGLTGEKSITPLGGQEYTPDNNQLLKRLGITPEYLKNYENTPKFDEWIKGSKAPEINYHGTPEFLGLDFGPTKPRNRGANAQGYYFTNMPDEASRYATKQSMNEAAPQVIPAYLNLKNPFKPGESNITNEMLTQYAKELKLNDPKISDEELNLALDLFKEYKQPSAMRLSGKGDDYARVIKAGGYDGMQEGPQHSMVFNPEQIRSPFDKDVPFGLRPEMREYKAWKKLDNPTLQNILDWNNKQNYNLYLNPNEENLQNLQKIRDLVSSQKAKSAADLFELNPTGIMPSGEYKRIDMPIQDFLNMAKRQSEPDMYKYNRVKNAVEQGIPLKDIPYLSFNSDNKGLAKISGHEGRHRALVLQEKGYTHMPVNIEGNNGKARLAWDRQNDPKDWYYAENWPKKLLDQDNIPVHEMPFPVTREDALKKYIPINEKYKPIDKGGFKDVYDSGDKVIKRFRPEEYGINEFLPEAMQEQAYLNKLKDITPKTKTYKAGDNIYQVQEKMTPFAKTTKDADKMIDMNRVMQDMLTNRGVDGVLTDVHPDNYGFDKFGNLKSFDVGTFQKIKSLTPEEIKELQNTFKTTPASSQDFLNELFKLKLGK